MSDLMIIECKNCGRAYKGRIDKPFLCPKCIEEGVILDVPQEIIEEQPVEPVKSEKIEREIEKSNFETIEKPITGVNPVPVENTVDAEEVMERLDKMERELLELSQFIHKIFR